MCPQTEKMRLLVADDQPDILEMIITAAQVDGRFVADGARSGEEIIEKINERCANLDECYDGIITDINFMQNGVPGMTGIMALATIRRQFPDIPVKILTADKYSTPVTRAQAAKYGAEISTKPVVDWKDFFDSIYLMCQMRPLAYGERRRKSVNVTHWRRRRTDRKLEVQPGISDTVQAVAQQSAAAAVSEIRRITTDAPK